MEDGIYLEHSGPVSAIHAYNDYWQVFRLFELDQKDFAFSNPVYHKDLLSSSPRAQVGQGALSSAAVTLGKAYSKLWHTENPHEGKPRNTIVSKVRDNLLREIKNILTQVHNELERNEDFCFWCETYHTGSREVDGVYCPGPLLEPDPSWIIPSTTSQSVAQAKPSKNCHACRFSYMEPDSGLICGHKNAGSFGLTIYKEPLDHCPDYKHFEQHPLRSEDGSLNGGKVS